MNLYDYIIDGLILTALLVDVYLIIRKLPTISMWTWAKSIKFPILPYAAGLLTAGILYLCTKWGMAGIAVVAGHLFWQRSWRPGEDPEATGD